MLDKWIKSLLAMCILICAGGVAQALDITEDFSGPGPTNGSEQLSIILDSDKTATITNDDVHVRTIHVGKEHDPNAGTTIFNGTEVKAGGGVYIHGTGTTTFNGKLTIDDGNTNPNEDYDVYITGGTNTFNGVVYAGSMSMDNPGDVEASTNTFKQEVQLYGGDKEVLHNYSLSINSGTNRFEGGISNVDHPINTEPTRHFVFMNTDTTVLSHITGNANNGSQSKLTIGYDENFFVDAGIPEEAGIYVDKKTEVTFGDGTGTFTADVEVYIGKGATVEAKSDALYTGTLTLANDAVYTASGTTEIQHKLKTFDNANVIFNGAVTANGLDINGSSQVTFNDDVTVADDVEIMDGNAKTTFGGALSAQVLCIDSTPWDSTNLGTSDNTFMGAVTLTGDGISESIGGKQGDFDLVLLDGKNTFESAVNVTRNNIDADNTANTAVFMRSHNTFKDELKVGDGLGTVTIGHWEDLTNWIDSSANPNYAGDHKKFQADPNYYKQTATVVLDGNDASISAGNMYVRENGVLQTNGDVTIDVTTTYVESNGKVTTNGSAAYNGNLFLLDNAQYTAEGKTTANYIRTGVDEEDGVGGFSGTAIFKDDVTAYGLVNINSNRDGITVFEKKLTIGDAVAKPDDDDYDLYICGGTNTFKGKVSAGSLSTGILMGGRGLTENTFKESVNLWGEDITGFKGYAITMVSGVNTFEKSVTAENKSAFFIDSQTTFLDALDVGAGSIDIGYIDSVIAKSPATDSEIALLQGKTTEVILGSENAKLKGSVVQVGKDATLTLTANAAIEGDAVFTDGSRLAIGSFEDASRGVYALSVSGTVTIEDGASMAVLGLDPTKAKGFTVLSANSIEGAMFNTEALSLYRLKKVDDVIVTDGMNSVHDIVDSVLKVASDNSYRAAALIDSIFSDSSSDQALQAKLGDGVTIATEIAKDNADLGRVAFSQLFAEYATAGASASYSTAQNFSNGITGHQTQLRDTGFASVDASVDSAPTAFASLRGTSQGYSGFNPNRIWGGGFGAWTRQNDRNNQFGYKYNSGGFILGYDREIGDMVFGVSTAYSSGRIKNNEGFTRTDVDTFNVGLYASYNHCSGFFVDANAGLGYAWNKMKTTDLIGGGGLMKEGKYRNTSLQAGLKIGYDFTLAQDFHIIPSVGLEYTHVHQKGWSEKIQSSSQIANWFDKTNNDYVSIPIGTRINKTFTVGDCVSVTPEIRGAWIYEAKDPKARVRMGYVGSGASTMLYGVDSGRSRGLVGAGLKARVRNVDAFVDYNYEFRSGYKNHNLMAGLGLSF